MPAEGGHAAWWLLPLAQIIGAHVMAAPVIHTDDTPIAVLAPGNGKTRTGRLWTYLVDERPWQGSRAPAAYYRFSPDRKGERPRDHLASFHGVIQADAYGGYEALARQAGPPGVNAPRITHAACWAERPKVPRAKHVEWPRRGTLVENCSTNSSGPNHRLPKRRSGASTMLYAIEAEITGKTADERQKIRRDHALPILADLKSWLQEQRRRLSSKTNLAKALQYALTRWDAYASTPPTDASASTRMYLNSPFLRGTNF